jgi:AcrR family transcriptional regulator
MRVKDENKQRALFEATIKVVGEIGFASSSVSKIAKEAGVSPATIYIYHENKEDLLVSTYVQIKKDLAAALMKDFDGSLPVRDIMKKVWLNGFEYAASHRERFNYKEQFAKSPFIDLVDETEIDGILRPIIEVFVRGVEEKILKDVDINLLSIFMYDPMTSLSDPRHWGNFEATPENIELAFDMAWDAIKQ